MINRKEGNMKERKNDERTKKKVLAKKNHY